MTAPWCLNSGAQAFLSYLKAVAWSMTLTIGVRKSEAVQLVPESSRVEFVSSLLGDGPILFPFWNAHSLLLLAALLTDAHLKQSSARLAAVADDSFGGLVTRRILAKLGIRCQPLGYRSQERRLDDLRTILREQPNLIMAADSHGPYRTVSTGMARLARGYRHVRPVSLACSRSLPLFREIGMALPLPGAALTMVLGEPLSVARTATLSAYQAALQGSLGDLETAAIALAMS